jgi:hypothetical protein
MTVAWINFAMGTWSSVTRQPLSSSELFARILWTVTKYCPLSMIQQTQPPCVICLDCSTTTCVQYSSIAYYLGAGRCPRPRLKEQQICARDTVVHKIAYHQSPMRWTIFPYPWHNQTSRMRAYLCSIKQFYTRVTKASVVIETPRNVSSQIYICLLQIVDRNHDRISCTDKINGASCFGHHAT